MNTFASDRKLFSIFQNHLFGYYTVRLSKLSKEVFFLYALKDGLISLFYVTSFKTELKDNSDPEKSYDSLLFENNKKCKSDRYMIKRLIKQKVLNS